MRDMDKIRVLLVDDHPVIRAGLTVTLTRDPALEVVGEAGDGVEALQMVAELRPDVVLMDLRLPRLDGIEAIKQIKETHPRTAVIVLTIYDHDAYVARAIRAGAGGYLIKDAPAALIRQTIKAVHRGETFKVSTPDSRSPMAAPETPLNPRYEAEPLSRLYSLTPRETEVLALLVEGFTNKAIARGLYISEVTAKKHVQSIISKLDSCGRTEAAVKAVRAGLLAGC
ncbi:MAG: two component transcriptional regulator, LuxR family [Dehalococcoidia bacterium]|nr:two component transcriptional regulator, LuxR family [Dehalococcoidia bacterium]